MGIGDREGAWITITMPAWRRLHGSGSGDISADSGTGPVFEVSLSGSGNVQILRLTSPDVVLRTPGQGDLTSSRP